MAISIGLKRDPGIWLRASEVLQFLQPSLRQRTRLNYGLTVKSLSVHMQFSTLVVEYRTIASVSWGHSMNQSTAVAARRHIVELEKRVAAQCTLIEQLAATNRDASQATRTLRVLQDALSLTKEHIRFLVRDETEAPPSLDPTAEQPAA